MKKLKLKALELGATEVLTRAQLKNILGGESGSDGLGGGYCNCYCGDGTTFSDPTRLDGCCSSHDACLSRCNSGASCDTGSMYALCKGSCAA